MLGIIKVTIEGRESGPSWKQISHLLYRGGGSNSQRVTLGLELFTTTALIASRHYTTLGIMGSKYHGLPDIVCSLRTQIN